jgi:ABC-type bacteriocin/lantibiotic exporter with double-glycine peptidase domain
MSIEIPHYAQEKRNTCALACLRMVLAAYGTHVPESELEAQARTEAAGTPIEEVERLARRYGLVAEIRQVTVEGLRQLLAEGKLPIAGIDRAIYDLSPEERRHHRLRNAKQHDVIPVKIGDRWVILHDPLEPRISRRTLRLFHQAYEALGGVSVVCAKPEDQPQPPGEKTI